MAGGDTGRVGTGSSPVERLIDQGLERYGKGDLDGALLAWENALSLAPDDARAVGYVDYVREHYALLRGHDSPAAVSELSVPFGLESLDDDAAYEIEVSDEAIRRARLEAYIDRVDDGWYLDDEVVLPSVARPLPLPATPEDGPAPVTFELEADEPPEPGAGEPDRPLNFSGFGGRSARGSEPPLLRPITATGDDDQTRDFGNRRVELGELAFDHGDVETDGDTDDFASRAETSDFVAHLRRGAAAEPPGEPGMGASPGAAATTATPDGASGDPDGDFDFDGAGDETSELKSRHLGFVKLSADPGDPMQGQPGSGFAGPDASTAELRVRFRKASQPPPASTGAASTGAARPSHDPSAADPTADFELPALGLDAPGTLDLGPPGALDLGNAAPVPITTTVSPSPTTPTSTSPFRRTPSSPPQTTGAAAPAAGAAAPASTGAAAPGAGTDDDERTQERGAWARARSPRASSSSSAIDLLDLDDGGSPSIAPPVIIDDPVLNEPSAFDPVHRNMPTREFPVIPKAPTPTLDFGQVPTTARTIPRAARLPAPPPIASTPPATPPLIAEIDVGAPAGETVEDRTRRRISALFERATAASGTGAHADAVAACDLALAEAPDSAVAQKLVHRNREAIIAIYQAFLGDLGSRPALAVPMHELAGEKIDSRAAFLLSRIDGNLSFEEILDVSGMTRLETLRHLARLVQRGILSVR